MKLKTVVQVLLGVAGLGLAVVIVGFLSFDWWVKTALTTAVSRQTGCSLQIERLQLGLRDGTLRVQGLTLGNPPGFGDLPLVSLPELYLAYDLAAARTNALRFHEVRLNLAQLSLVVDAQGRTNVAEIVARLDRAGLGTQQPVPTNLLGGMSFAGIGRLQVSLGSVRYADLRAPAADRSLELGITNRMLTNVVSAAQLLPLGLEVMFKTAWQLR